MTPPLSPERLTRLLDDAVRPVTARPGTLDRIRQGTPRRHTARRAAVVVLAAAVIAGGTATALVVTTGGPARIASPPASGPVFSSAAKAALPAGQTRTAAQPTADQQAVPILAPSTLPSSAGSAPSSTRQPVLAPPSASASSSASQPVVAPPGPSASASAPSSVPPSTPSSPPPSTPSLVPSSPLSSPPASANRPVAGAPSVAGSVAWAVDGPGQPAARVTLVPVGNARTTFSFLLVVHTVRYGTQTVPFSAASVTGMPPFGPVVVGAANAAKDGHTELFVMVNAGCCTEFWTIFRLVDGHVVQVRLAGAPVRLAVGGSVTDNGGFSCAGPYLITNTYAYQPSSGTRMTFLATRDTYRWAGAALVLVSHRQVTIRGAQNPELAQYSGVSCGALPQYVLKR